MKYFDAHCHVQFDDYDADREILIEEMRAQGVAGIVVGCDSDSSKKAVALAEKYEHLWAAVGLHPNHAANEQYDISYYRQLAENKKVVAIGECGLDYFRPQDMNDEVKEKQKILFKQHIEIAAEFDKPLIIHCRPSRGTMDAYRDLVAILKEAKAAHDSAVRGDVHFFVGGIPEMRELAALGFTVSFTAVITFARDYDAVIKAASLDMILSETDAPYLAPASRRGQRNDSLAIPEIVTKIAEIRGEDVEMVRETLLATSRRVFNLP